MFASALQIIGWVAAALLVVVTLLLALNKQTGLKVIQHRADMLPQAMLVRYAGLSALAVLAVFFGAPRLLFSMLLALAVIGLGDAFIYRRAGHPFWLHLIVGAASLIGAFLALFSIS